MIITILIIFALVIGIGLYRTKRKPGSQGKGVSTLKTDKPGIKEGLPEEKKPD